jgi:hypothetical protein
MSVVIGTRVVDCDLFDKPSTCSKDCEPLLSGLVFDALEAKESSEHADTSVATLRGVLRTCTGSWASGRRSVAMA